MLNVQGQDRAVATVQRAMRAGRLASTWLFAGPIGVGKFTFGVELAKTILCDAPRLEKNAARVKGLPENFELKLPCEACESCRAIAAGNHPDLHIITKELIRYHDKTGKSKGTTLSIDVIRGEITGDPAESKEAKIYKRSFRGRGKFFIIDEADLMEAPAQNALLKTLEEPPNESYLILITASPAELLSTIRSRSQVVHFNELPTDIIIQRLAAEGLSPADAALIARLARGSLGRAFKWAENITVIEQKQAKEAERRAKKAADDSDEDEESKFTTGGILAWTRELAAALDGLAAGSSAASEVAALISKFAAEYSALALHHDRLTSADRAKRDGIGLMMAIAAEWFSDRIRFAVGVPPSGGTAIPSNAGALNPDLVPRLIASARSAEAEIDMNANDKILLAATTTRWEQLLNESR